LVHDGKAQPQEESFKKGGLVQLDGQWGFTWNKDQTADLNAKGESTMTLPSYWTISQAGRYWPTIGSATYHLDLQLPDDKSPWALYLPDISTSWALAANGQILATSGTPSMDPRVFRAFVRPKVVLLPRGNENLHLAIFVVNLNDRVAGIRDSILLGRANEVEQYYQINVVSSSFFVGGLIVMVLFNLTIYMLQRRRGANLWLAIFAFFVAVRTFLTGPRIVFDLFPLWPLEMTSKIEFVAMFGAVISFIFYMRYIFPDWWPRRLFQIYVGYNLLFIALAFFLPLHNFANTVVTFYDLPLALFAFTILGISTWALIKKHEDGLLFFVGFLLLVGGTLNDLAYQFFPLSDGYVLGQLLFVFMFFHTFLLSRQLSKDYDLTQKQSAGLRKLDKLKDGFLARVTHELRTPIHGMAGILDAFRLGDYGALTERQTYHIGLLDSSAKRLLSLVNSILDFNQLRQHGARWERRPVNLKHLIDFLMPSFFPHVQPGVGLFNHITEHIPSALGDEIKLEQVFQHLVLNAIQHTEQGSVTIEAEVVGQEILILIRDTGSGISKQTLEQLFTPFYQASEIDTRNSGGLGLGLSTSRQILVQMGGRLEVASEEGKGTTARISLPICPPSRKEYFERDRIERTLVLGQEGFVPSGTMEAPQGTPSASEPINQSGLTVLIVDDEPVNLLVLKTFLTRTGYQVLEAANGKEALELSQQHSLDLVILDVMMPQMSGYEVCERLRQSFTTSRLPVILLTAKNQIEDLIHGYQSGANDFLTKPFQREELKARMELHLQVSLAARNTFLKTERT